MRLKTKFGFLIEAFPNGYIDRVIYEQGFYESEVLDALLFNAPDKCVFWDIGANIGIHSLGFKFKMPGSRVVSFEPECNNFNRLRNNTLLNGLTLDLINVPLSDKFELTKLFSDENNHGRSTLAPHNKGGYSGLPYLVMAVPGDYLVENQLLPAPDLIKIDVEGYELNVLKGLINTLRSRKTFKIIFEAPYNFLSEDSEMKSLLANLGYSISLLNRNEPTHHNLENFEAKF